jgi:hypothetical protein
MEAALGEIATDQPTMPVGGAQIVKTNWLLIGRLPKG